MVATTINKKNSANTEVGMDSEKTNTLLLSEFYWIEALIKFRINELCQAQEQEAYPEPPEIQKGVHVYFDYLIDAKVDLVERIALSLVLIANTFPKFLDYFYTNNQVISQPFREFGIRFEGDSKKMITSWQTVFFLYLGTSLGRQLSLVQYIHLDHWLYKENLLIFPKEKKGNPFLTALQLNTDKLYAWLYPKNFRNLADQSFAAHEISATLNWSDLFISKETEKGLVQLRLWLKHGAALRKDPKFSKFITPGVRVLFYGPSGTGKTLTASLLGKEFELPVYRVDLSQMVSKWVGETEKNLARIFDMAEQRQWILFFDEADALFSKRATVTSANDRRSNQEISYLLQRIENFDGVIIMATNLKDAIDDAFIRRFQSMIHFPIPNKTIRAGLWRHLLEDTFPKSNDVDLEQIAEDYELTGGSMKNIFRALLLELYDKEPSKQVITKSALVGVIQNELSKSGIVSVRKRF